MPTVQFPNICKMRYDACNVDCEIREEWIIEVYLPRAQGKCYVGFDSRVRAIIGPVVMATMANILVLTQNKHGCLEADEILAYILGYHQPLS